MKKPDENGSKAPQPRVPHPDEICPVCGAAGEPLSCKLVCPKCRIVLINCSES